MDEYTPNEVWVCIDAWDDNAQLQWEMTRAICFNVAKFGQSDPKKFPKSPEKFWPFPWDRKAAAPDTRVILEQHARMVARRKAIELQMQNEAK